MTNYLHHFQPIPRTAARTTHQPHQDLEVVPAVVSRPSYQLLVRRSLAAFSLRREGTDPASRGRSGRRIPAAPAGGVA